MRPPTPLILAARLLAVAIIALFGVVLALPRGGDGVAIAATGLLAPTRRVAWAAVNFMKTPEAFCPVTVALAHASATVTGWAQAMGVHHAVATRASVLSVNAFRMFSLSNCVQ